MSASFSSSISKTNPNIMEYLALKLEAKSKEIPFSKQIICGLFDIQSLMAYKKHLAILLTEIEEDLKQASYAIKGLFIENKALTLEIDQLKERVVSSDENSISCINELAQSNHFLLAENAELKERLSLCGSNGNDRRDECNKQLCNITEEAEIEIPVKKLITQTSEGSHRLGSDYDHYSPSRSNSKEKGFGTVRSIISNMKSTKIKLKEEIRKYLQCHPQDSKFFGDSGDEKEEGKESSSEKKAKPTNLNRKEKASELLTQIIKNEATLELLNKRLGKDFMQKMLRNDCTEDYLKKIENILTEANSKTKDKINYPLRIRNYKTRSKSKSFSKNNNNSAKKEKARSFSNSFCKQTIPASNTVISKANTSIENTVRENPKKSKQVQKDAKPKFNNYLNPYGKYFTNPNEQAINIKPINR